MTQQLFNSLDAQRPRFWRRQFTAIPTETQDTFDVIFAVVLPILCLVADPIVFKGGSGMWNHALLEDYQLLAYLVSTVEIGFFLTWRTFRRSLAPFAPALAGIFFAGAAFSTMIGFMILPFSLIGLIVLIGAFGFIPFLTAFVFLRNGVRALRIPGNHPSWHFRLAAAALSSVLVIALPMLVSTRVEKDIATSVDTLVAGNAVQAEAAATRLKRFRFVPSKYSNRIGAAYWKELDPVKRHTLNVAYRDITGVDLDQRAGMYAD